MSHHRVPGDSRRPEGLADRLRERARTLRRDVQALALAFVHPATPWHARLYLGLVVAYLLSPIDLIPDFIPIVGYLDELVLVPLFLLLALGIVPSEILAECRARAADAGVERRLRRRGALVVVMVWIALLSLLAAVVVPRLAAARRQPVSG